MEFLGWTVFVLPSLEGNSLLNCLIAISHVEFACFRLAAGEFLGWKPLASHILGWIFHKNCLGLRWNSAGGTCLLSCVGNLLGGISCLGGNFGSLH